MREQKTVLITGASSGIGHTAAALFHAKGWNVAATMRRPEDQKEACAGSGSSEKAVPRARSPEGARMRDEDVECACGARFARSTWSSLTIVTRIEPDEARTMLLNWPYSVWIDVRCCPRCARSIAIKRTNE